MMSLQWSNNWEPKLFNEQHQNIILSLLAHLAVSSAGPLSPCLCYLHFFFKASATAWFISLLWPSLKFSWTWGAGGCKPLTRTHYFLFPHKDQNVQLQWEVLKCGVGEGKSVGSIMWEMKMHCRQSRRKGTPHYNRMKEGQLDWSHFRNCFFKTSY
jgi:hypothetical protein